MTAEAAVVIPALVLFVSTLLWGVMAAVARIQCVDAAREGARAVARGEPAEGVRAVVREAGPDGVAVETNREGELVRVTVRARSTGPGPLAVRLTEEAVASREGPGEAGDEVPGTDGAGAVPDADAYADADTGTGTGTETDADTGTDGGGAGGHADADTETDGGTDTSTRTGTGTDRRTGERGEDVARG
ncbi:TadE family type IV pilus minor pilin [Streptomyces sp. NPDC048172]|uniref:TadE family type IV pilus minor pilin n=1 Tax=Streptomyces sp. NPDC048172 TaxID=3365505 RepID=UPI00371E315C